MDKQTGASIAAKFVSRALLSLDAVMAEVNIIHNLRHSALIQPTSVYETKTAYVIVMPL